MSVCQRCGCSEYGAETLYCTNCRTRTRPWSDQPFRAGSPVELWVLPGMEEWWGIRWYTKDGRFMCRLEGVSVDA